MVAAAADIVAALYVPASVTGAVVFCGTPSTWWPSSAIRQAREGSCFACGRRVSVPWDRSSRPQIWRCALAHEIWRVRASLRVQLGCWYRVQETGRGCIGDLSQVDPGPADSAVVAGSGAWAVGSKLGHFVSKVGFALVSG